MDQKADYSLISLHSGWRDRSENWRAALEVAHPADKPFYMNKEVFLSSYC